MYYPIQSVIPFCSCFNQELGRENSSADEKIWVDYLKSHWKGSKIYRFSLFATQIFLPQPTMVADITEDFEPPPKIILATLLIAILYRSPSQNRLECDTFISNFGKILGAIHSFNPGFSILLGDFNARLNNWWGVDTQTSEVSWVDSLTTSYGLRQLILEPTHILKNSSSCFDLIFTDQPSRIIDSGTQPLLHPNCHHKIIHCEIDLKII